MNRASEGVISSDQCVLPSKPTARPPFVQPTTTTAATTTMTTTTTTTTTTPAPTKPPYFRTDIAFDGDSVIRLKDNLVDLEKLITVGPVTISLKFTTAASDGLLLWKGQRLPEYDYDEYSGPYLAIAGELIIGVYQSQLCNSTLKSCGIKYTSKLISMLF